MTQWASSVMINQTFSDVCSAGCVQGSGVGLIPRDISRLCVYLVFDKCDIDSTCIDMYGIHLFQFSFGSRGLCSGEKRDF